MKSRVSFNPVALSYGAKSSVDLEIQRKDFFCDGQKIEKTGKHQRSRESPTAAHCYRYCLAHPAVKVVLTARKSIQELE